MKLKLKEIQNYFHFIFKDIYSENCTVEQLKKNQILKDLIKSLKGDSIKLDQLIN